MTGVVRLALALASAVVTVGCVGVVGLQLWRAGMAAIVAAAVALQGWL